MAGSASGRGGGGRATPRAWASWAQSAGVGAEAGAEALGASGLWSEGEEEEEEGEWALGNMTDEGGEVGLTDREREKRPILSYFVSVCLGEVVEWQ